MKRLFKGGRREEWRPKYLSSSSSYNLPPLPRVSFTRCLEEGELHQVLRGLPDSPFDRIIYHCWGKLTPPQVPLMFELHRVTAGPVVLFHHQEGKAAKRYRRAMRLVGFKRNLALGRDSISVWGPTDDFKMPRCKTKVPLEAQSKRFYRSLLRGSKHVLEVFPECEAVGEAAVANGTPVTFFLLGEGSDKALVEKLGGTFDVVQ